MPTYDQEIFLRGLMGLGDAWDKERLVNQGASPAQQELLRYYQNRLNGPGLDGPPVSPLSANSPAFQVGGAPAPMPAPMGLDAPVMLDEVRPRVADADEPLPVPPPAPVAPRFPTSSEYAKPLPRQESSAGEAQPTPPRLNLDLTRISRRDADAARGAVGDLIQMDEQQKSRRALELLRQEGKDRTTTTTESGKDRRQQNAIAAAMVQTEMKIEDGMKRLILRLDQQGSEHAERIKLGYAQLTAAMERVKFAQEEATKRTQMNVGKDERIAAMQRLQTEANNARNTAARVVNSLSYVADDPLAKQMVGSLTAYADTVSSAPEYTAGLENMGDLASEGAPQRPVSATTTETGGAASGGATSGGGAVGAQPAPTPALKAAPAPAPAPAPQKSAAPPAPRQQTTEDLVYGDNRPKQGAAPAQSPAPAPRKQGASSKKEETKLIGKKKFKKNSAGNWVPA